MNGKKQESENLTREDKELEEFLWKHVSKAAETWEKEILNDPDLSDIQPAPDLFDRIMKQVEEETAGTEEEQVDKTGDLKELESSSDLKASRVEDLLSEEDRLALEIGRRKLHRKKYHRVFRSLGVAAAVMVLVMAVGVSSEANRIKLLNLWNTLSGKEEVVQFSNYDGYSDAEIQMKEDIKQIKSEVGIDAVYFTYRPQKLAYQDCTIEKEVNRAWMRYSYGDFLVTVMMMDKKTDMAYGETQDGNIIDEMELHTQVGDVEIKESKGNKTTTYTAKFTYDNCYYRVNGVMPKEEFLKMIEYMVV